MDAYRDSLLAGEIEYPQERWMVRARTLSGGQVGEIVVPRHHLADAFEHTGELLHPLDDHVPDLIEHLYRVLATHQNHVFIDLSWVVYPNYILKDLNGWSALIRRYPDNFVLGSDAVGRFGDYPDQIRIYEPLFDALGDPNLIEKVASRNFLRIMRTQGIALDPSYHYPESRYSQQPLRSR